MVSINPIAFTGNPTKVVNKEASKVVDRLGTSMYQMTNVKNAVLLDYVANVLPHQAAKNVAKNNVVLLDYVVNVLPHQVAKNIAKNNVVLLDYVANVLPHQVAKNIAKDKLDKIV